MEGEASLVDGLGKVGGGVLFSVWITPRWGEVVGEGSLGWDWREEPDATREAEGKRESGGAWGVDLGLGESGDEEEVRDADADGGGDEPHG